MSDYQKERLERQRWLAGLKKGDTVAMLIGGIGMKAYQLGTIAYITPKRTRIDILWAGAQVPEELDGDGMTKRSRGSWSPRSQIEAVTEKVLTTNKVAELNRRLEKLVMNEHGHRPRNDLTISQMERIISILEEERGQEPNALPRSADLEQH